MPERRTPVSTQDEPPPVDHADVPAALQRALPGRVLAPGSPDYGQARQPAFARLAEVRPLAIVRCRDERDVAVTLAGIPRSAA